MLCLPLPGSSLTRFAKNKSHLCIYLIETIHNKHLINLPSKVFSILSFEKFLINSPCGVFKCFSVAPSVRVGISSPSSFALLKTHSTKTVNTEGAHFRPVRPLSLIVYLKEQQRVITVGLCVHYQTNGKITIISDISDNQH